MRGCARRECAAAMVEIRFSLKAPLVGTRHELARILAADPDSKLTGMKIGQIPKSPRVGNPGALSGVTSSVVGVRPGGWGEGWGVGEWPPGLFLRGIRANVMGKAQPKAAEAMTAVATVMPMTMPVTVSDVAFAEA